MARPPRRLLLLAVALPGSFAIVTATEGVLAALALLGAVSLVNVEDEQAVPLGLQVDEGARKGPSRSVRFQ